MYRNLQRHRGVIPATARLLFWQQIIIFRGDMPLQVSVWVSHTNSASAWPVMIDRTNSRQLQLNKKLSYRRETARQLHMSMLAESDWSCNAHALHRTSQNRRCCTTIGNSQIVTAKKASNIAYSCPMKFSNITYTHTAWPISFKVICLCVIRNPLCNNNNSTKATDLTISAKCVKWKITNFSGALEVTSRTCYGGL